MSKYAITIPIIALLAIGIVFSLLFARHQARLWVYPARHLPTLTPEAVGLSRWEDIQFETPDGLRLTGWFIYPETNAETPRATLILLHGIGANRSAMLTEASLLVPRGYNVLMIDLRGHGSSGGKQTTLGYNEVYDVQGAVDYLQTRHDVDPQRIGLFGRSLGGAVALRAAAQIPDIRIVIAESTFKTIEDNVIPIVRALTGQRPFPFPSAVLWFVKMETGVPVNEIRPINDLAQISPRPLLFIHGGQDFVVPAHNSQDMYEAAGEPKELFLLPNGQHTKLVAIDPVGYETQLTAFLDKYLGAQPGSR